MTDETRSGASSYPSAGELLEAIEALLHWRSLRAYENQGGLWFYDPAGIGTRRLGPTEIRVLYEQEAKSRGLT